MKQAATDTGPAPMSCSFCNKTQHELAVLIAGPNVNICDECVELCDEIIATRGGERAAQLNVRAVTLTTCTKWEPPTPEEVRIVLSAAGLTKAAAARLIGVSDGRVVGRWLAAGEESSIPYACWALLCQVAGLGLIWGLVRPTPVRD